LLIKPKDVVFIRTTEEPVFVLQVNSKEEAVTAGSIVSTSYPELSGVSALVRRPMQGDKGLYHVVERFQIEELATHDEMRQAEAIRFIEGREAAKKVSSAAAQVNEPSDLPN